MSCVDAVILQDSNGVLWSLSINDDGTGNLQSVAQGVPVTVTLADYVRGQTAFQLVVTPGGTLTTVPAAWNPTLPNYKQFSTPAGNLLWLLVNDDGSMQSIFRGKEGPTYLVGTLITFPIDNSNPKYTQPGGVGTTVFPQEDPGYAGVEPIMPVGRFVGGCGHWFNSPEVVTAFTQCDLGLLALCPLCHYLLQVVDPVEFYGNGEPLVV